MTNDFVTHFLFLFVIWVIATGAIITLKLFSLLFYVIFAPIAFYICLFLFMFLGKLLNEKTIGVVIIFILLFGGYLSLKIQSLITEQAFHNKPKHLFCGILKDEYEVKGYRYQYVKWELENPITKETLKINKPSTYNYAINNHLCIQYAIDKNWNNGDHYVFMVYENTAKVY